MKTINALAILLVSTSCVTVRPNAEAVYANQLCADAASHPESPGPGAESYCNRALQLFPEYSDAWANRGRLLLRQGNRRDAQASFEASLRHDSRNATATEGLGSIALAEGRLNDAIILFRRAAYLAPDAPKPRYALAVAYYFDKQKEEAKREALALVSRMPEYAQGYHLAAVLFLEEGDADKAAPFAHRALQLDPRRGVHWLALAAAYERQGRREDAEYSLRSCLEVEPKREECQKGLFSLGQAQSPLAVKLELSPP